MRRAAVVVVALFAAGCGGSSGGGSSSTSTSPATRTVSTAKRSAAERAPAAAAVLGVAGRYVDAHVADGGLPPVHVGRAGIVGKVALVYLVGGSDVGGAGSAEPPKGLYGVVVLAKHGDRWRVRPPVIRLHGRS